MQQKFICHIRTKDLSCQGLTYPKQVRSQPLFIYQVCNTTCQKLTTSQFWKAHSAAGMAVLRAESRSGAINVKDPARWTSVVFMAKPSRIEGELQAPTIESKHALYHLSKRFTRSISQTLCHHEDTIFALITDSQSRVQRYLSASSLQASLIAGDENNQEPSGKL